MRVGPRYGSGLGLGADLDTGLTIVFKIMTVGVHLSPTDMLSNKNGIRRGRYKCEICTN